MKTTKTNNKWLEVSRLKLSISFNNDTKVNVNTIKTLITNSKIYGENHIYSPKIMNNNSFEENFWIITKNYSNYQIIILLNI